MYIVIESSNITAEVHQESGEGVVGLARRACKLLESIVALTPDYQRVLMYNVYMDNSRQLVNSCVGTRKEYSIGAGPLEYRVSCKTKRGAIVSDLWKGDDESLDDFMTRVYEECGRQQRLVSKDIEILIQELHGDLEPTIIDRYYGMKGE